LYDDTDLQTIGYSFRRAGNVENKPKLKLSPQMEKLLRQNPQKHVSD